MIYRICLKSRYAHININVSTATNFVLSRSAPRKVCTILGNGIAIYCDKDCHHGEYNSRGEESEITDDDMFKWVPENFTKLSFTLVMSKLVHQCSQFSGFPRWSPSVSVSATGVRRATGRGWPWPSWTGAPFPSWRPCRVTPTRSTGEDIILKILFRLFINQI